MKTDENTTLQRKYENALRRLGALRKSVLEIREESIRIGCEVDDMKEEFAITAWEMANTALITDEEMENPLPSPCK